MPILVKLGEGLSRDDFINKFGIALKEADETKYWFEILQATGREIPTDMMIKCEELIKTLVGTIKNSKNSVRITHNS